MASKTDLNPQPAWLSNVWDEVFDTRFGTSISPQCVESRHVSQQYPEDTLISCDDAEYNPFQGDPQSRVPPSRAARREVAEATPQRLWRSTDAVLNPEVVVAGSGHICGSARVNSQYKVAPPNFLSQPQLHLHRQVTQEALGVGVQGPRGWHLPSASHGQAHHEFQQGTFTHFSYGARSEARVQEQHDGAQIRIPEESHGLSSRYASSQQRHEHMLYDRHPEIQQPTHLHDQHLTTFVEPPAQSQRGRRHMSEMPSRSLETSGCDQHIPGKLDAVDILQGACARERELAVLVAGLDSRIRTILGTGDHHAPAKPDSSDVLQNACAKDEQIAMLVAGLDSKARAILSAKDPTRAVAILKRASRYVCPEEWGIFRTSIYVTKCLEECPEQRDVSAVTSHVDPKLGDSNASSQPPSSWFGRSKERTNHHAVSSKCKAMQALKERLKEWRTNYARVTNSPAFNILTNQTVEELAKIAPKSRQELISVRGIGQRKLEEFGDAILEICRCQSEGLPTRMSLPDRLFMLPTANAKIDERECTEPPWKRMCSGRHREVLKSTIQKEMQEICEDMLNEEQHLCVDRAMAGENLFITGAAGTGKSFLLRFLVQELEKHYPGKVAITAPTGIAAVNVGGQTIHSWAGVGFGKTSGQTNTRDHLLNLVRSRPATSSRWLNTHVLVIDEVSMLDPELFETLSAIGCALRNNETCSFGGMQLLLCGDFLQLPPVSASDPTGPKWTFCFETPAWHLAKLDKGTIILQQPVRQSGDKEFVETLNEIRAGQCSVRVITALTSCCVATSDQSGKILPTDGIEPTRLYSVNRNVDLENEARLEELDGNMKPFQAQDEFLKKGGTDSEKQRLEDLMNKKVPFELRVKVGAQVVLLRKLSGHGLVNGSRGVVNSYDIAGVIVRFDNGQLVRVERDCHRQVGLGGAELRRIQIPLKLGWALTIHKAQGLTLSRAEVRLDDCFSYGQAYVALSRLTGFEGLWIRGGISPKKIQAHPAAKAFYGLDDDAIS